VPGDPSQTVIEELSATERRTELERMLGGEEFLTAIASELEQ
jgi:DNA repair ATPase RecN